MTRVWTGPFLSVVLIHNSGHGFVAVTASQMTSRTFMPVTCTRVVMATKSDNKTHREYGSDECGELMWNAAKSQSHRNTVIAVVPLMNA